MILHGSDVWNNRRGARRLLENYLLRSQHVRAVTVSNFTAGALSSTSSATILPPGISAEWYGTLLRAADRSRKEDGSIHLVSVFRLPAWKDKGLPQLLEAIASVDRSDIRLTVCGGGSPPAELHRLVQRYSFCVIRPQLSDEELAIQLAAADLFVLATRTRSGRHPSGEGFGMVLQEAQLAGTPVVAPAYGGSHEAFVEQVTGMAPADDSSGALAKVLDEMVRDRSRLAQMGTCAGDWARDRFSPDNYASLVIGRLM